LKSDDKIIVNEKELMRNMQSQQETSLLRQCETFKSLMEDCPVCGERCSGKPVKWVREDETLINRGVWCFKADMNHPPNGWSLKQSVKGFITATVTSEEAKTLWDTIVKDARWGAKSSGASRHPQGMGKKTKAVSAQYFISQKAKNAFVEQLVQYGYYAHRKDAAAADLFARGLTEEQIIKHKIFDLEQQGHTPSRIDAEQRTTALEWLGRKAFRGLEKGDTWKLSHRLDGYLVPIFNYNQEITGFQIRTYPHVIKQAESNQREMKRLLKEGYTVHNSEEEIVERFKNKGVYVPPKYLWAKGITQAGKEVSSHLSMGHELPLQTLKAAVPSKTLLFVEGTLKPIVVYERLGGQFHVLGAAGGSFTSSRTILLHTLQAFVQEYAIQNVVWLADAGSYARTTQVAETQAEYRERRERELHLKDYTEDAYGRVPTLKSEARKAAWAIINAEMRELSGKWADVKITKERPYKRSNVVNNIAYAKDFVERCGLSFSVADWGQLEVEGEKDSLDPDVVDTGKILAALPPKLQQVDENAPFKQARLNAFYNNHHRTVAFNFPRQQYNTVKIESSDEIVSAIATHPEIKIKMIGTPTGIGKSTVVSSIPFQEMGYDKLIYVSQTTRNPVTAEIESLFYPVEGRHDGLVRVEGQLTPNGHYVNRRANGNEERQTEPNCARFAEHNAARENHLDTQGICHSCPFLKDCRSGEHEHYNYLYQRAQSRQHPMLRATTAVLNPADINEKTMIVFDENYQCAPPSEEVSFSAGDFAEYISLIDRKFGVEQGGLVVDKLGNIQPGSIPFEMLPSIAEQVNQDLIEKRKRLSQCNSKQRILPAKAVKFVNLLLAKTRWNFNEYSQTFTATVRNEHVLSLIENAGTVVLMDATCIPEIFCVEYGLNPEDCLFVTADDKATENVTVVPLLTEHWNGRQYSTDKQTILDRTRKGAEELHGEGNVGTISFKANIAPGDMKWGGESRGSNRFAQKTAVIAAGLPFINIDAMSRRYMLHKEKYEELGISEENYQNTLLHAEIKQGMGRLRGFHRTEPLKFYILCNASFPQLEAEGYKVEPELLADWGVTEAYTTQLESIDALIPALKKLCREGVKMTQQALANAADKSRQSVSKQLKKLGVTLADLAELAKQSVASALPVPAARFFGLTPELKEDIKKRKERVEAGQIDELAQYQELASQAEVVRALQSIQEGWYPKGIRRTDLFYLQTTLLSNITRDIRFASGRQNMSVWDTIVDEWETEQILEDIYACTA
jgi:hypothetical protein